MILAIQIKTLLYSFLFGIYFSIFITLNYRITNKLKKNLKIISTFLVIFINVLFFFLILMKVNNGIIHIYSILAILLGSILEYYLHHLFEKYTKK